MCYTIFWPSGISGYRGNGTRVPGTMRRMEPRRTELKNADKSVDNDSEEGTGMTSEETVWKRQKTSDDLTAAEKSRERTFVGGEKLSDDLIEVTRTLHDRDELRLRVEQAKKQLEKFLIKLRKGTPVQRKIAESREEETGWYLTMKLLERTRTFRRKTKQDARWRPPRFGSGGETKEKKSQDENPRDLKPRWSKELWQSSTAASTRRLPSSGSISTSDTGRKNAMHKGTHVPTVILEVQAPQREEESAATGG